MPPPSPAAIAQALHRLHRTTGPACGVGPPVAREALVANGALDPRPEGFAWRIAVYRLWYLLLCHPPEIGALLDETIECVARDAPG